jgi:hypothetical protein
MIRPCWPKRIAILAIARPMLPSDLSVTDKDRIAGLVREFARQDVVIAEVGAWKNMLDPDPEKRRQ